MECLSDYDFYLPAELIAQYPLPERRDARLLALQKSDLLPRHHPHFPAIKDYLKAGDALVMNNTKVFPARLFGRKSDTGGQVEVLLVRPLPDGTWSTLLSARRPLGPGAFIEFMGENGAKNSSRLIAKVLGRLPQEPGAYQLSFDGDALSWALTFGHIPLPPYMNRLAQEADKERYQTVFADSNEAKAVAAPTAGLHFDELLLDEMRAMGVKVIFITLHVGPGTFLPIRTEDISQHVMHQEPWSISKEAAFALGQVRKEGGRIIAVGTTAVRTLETAAADLKKQDFAHGLHGLTQLFIRPGFLFQLTDALITNFHVPKTTLLLLVAAAVRKSRLMQAYEEAIAQKYRFFSYGDACYFELLDEAKQK